jgi:hypothetical protein
LVRLRKTTVTAVRISRIVADFRTEDFRNWKQEWEPLNHDVVAACGLEVPTAMEATETGPVLIQVQVQVQVIL